MTAIPDTTTSITHHFTIADVDGYMIVSLHDGKPVVLNLRIARLGSTISGLMDAVANLATLALQSGASVQQLAARLAGAKFEPMGHSHNSDIGYAHSLTDYVFRWLELRFPESVEAGQQETA
jgi:ribonucleoside-diphosphate reductase alpha chain